MNHTITLHTNAKEEMIDLTKQVDSFLAEHKIENGLCHVFCKHTSAAIIINENYDPKICNDILKKLEDLIPDKAGYEHDVVDGNAASHIKSTVLGPSETVPISNGKLVLGTWQQITFVELDGPRTREIHLTVLSANS